MIREISLDLTIEDINNILAALGQLPTSSNAYPLYAKIKAQAEQRLAAQIEQPAAKPALAA